MYFSAWSFTLARSPAFRRPLTQRTSLANAGKSRLKAGLQAHALRTLIKQKNDIQTTLRELPLDKLEKLGEMLAELKSNKV